MSYDLLCISVGTADAGDLQSIDYSYAAFTLYVKMHALIQ